MPNYKFHEDTKKIIFKVKDLCKLRLKKCNYIKLNDFQNYILAM